METVGLDSHVPADRRRIGALLDKASRPLWTEHRIVLSAIVHRRTGGKTRPGPGFAALLADLPDYPEFDDDEVDDLVDQEVEKVVEFYRSTTTRRRAR